MCFFCWREYGSPTEWVPTTRRVVDLIEQLYAHCPTGGPLHAVVDDWNVEGDDIRPGYVIPPFGETPGFPDDYSEDVHRICDELAGLMSAMSVPQRMAALAYSEKHIAAPDLDEATP